jgi:ubiquinone/menaquinone biosynthesis C-methylase UbiE
MKPQPTVLLAGFTFALGLTLQAQDHKPPHGTHGPAGQRPDHMEHSFADVERYSKTFDDPARDAWQMPDRVITTLGIKPGAIVADIGAGTGYFTVRLAKSAAAPKVYAVDIEKAMVDHVRHRAMNEGLKNVVAVRAGADRTNLPEAVDVALIVNTYHHLPNRVAYFTALKKLLKPGARLAIIDFKKGAPDGPPDQFRFTPNQISAELGQAGFKLQAEHDVLPRQLFLIYILD